MDETAAKLLSGFQSVEAVVDRLLNARDRAVELDRQRQGIREALHVLRKGGDPPRKLSLESRVWVFRNGPVPVQLSRADAVNELETNMRRIEDQIKAAREEQKRHMQALEEKGELASKIGGASASALLSLRDPGGTGAADLLGSASRGPRHSAGRLVPDADEHAGPEPDFSKIDASNLKLDEVD
ncbi:unnamed protein product [Pedinophyceae sp. YPF-701]|nr:unnamed protein product [Pedinophyceae sp. YPF-701]